MHSRLVIAALLSPARKGLTSWLLLVMFIVFFVLSHMVFWASVVQMYLIVSFPDLCRLSNFGTPDASIMHLTIYILNKSYCSLFYTTVVVYGKTAVK